MARSVWQAIVGVLVVVVLSLAGCGEPVVEATDGVAVEAVEGVGPEVGGAAPVVVERAGDEVGDEAPLVGCRAVGERLVLCPTGAMVRAWAAEHAVAAEVEVKGGLRDPVAREDGLVLYERLLREVAPETRVHLELWAWTPELSGGEVAWFEAHPEVWRDVVRFRSAAGAGRVREWGRLRKAWGGDREAMRHAVLRSGVFFIDDARTAAVAARQLTLEDLFDAPELVLERAGERFVVRRGADGAYVHVGGELEGYRARLNVLDRVGVEGELEPLPGFGLASLRRALALDHVEAKRGPGGRMEAVAVMFGGERFEGELVRTQVEAASLVVVATPEAWASASRGSAREQEAIGRLKAATFAMVRENLFFDEPANEEGQQDGIMRMAFAEAYRRGEVQYEVNGVTYEVFDRQGRARPPQVCVDFVTDAVERSAGRWWPGEEAEARGRTAGRIDIREVLPYRQVWRLVDIPKEHPGVAQVRSFGPSERAPFEQTGRFHAQLRRHRDELREGDVIVIYGLRDDGRHHYHSFYVYETDPVRGVPTLLVDQAGHARLRPWNVIMRGAPKRSIHHRLRWSPDWLLEPEAVRAASGVVGEAGEVAARMEALW